MTRTILLIAVTLAALGIFTLRAVVPAMTGLTPIVINGSSMDGPNGIPLGALAYVDPNATPQVGSIISYHSGPQVVTHRIVADVSGNADWWATAGDKTGERDPYFVTPDAIIGVATIYIPWLGTISQILSLLPVMAFIALASIAIVVWPALTAPPPAKPHPAA